MSKTRLFAMAIPCENTQRTPLYIHTSVQGDPRMVPQGQSITLDTYFNSFSWAKYLRYTNVTNVTATFDLTGSWKIEWLSRGGEARQGLVATAEYLGTERRSVEFPLLLPEQWENGFFWFRLTALSNNCMILGGEYLTDAPLQPVQVSAVICTFRREEFVIKNVERIKKKLIDSAASSVADCLTLYVIDNGHSLEGRLPEHTAIRLFSNKNCGGSGGFTRGIMEVLRESNSSHIILMDDDIEVDPEVFEKTVSFLKHLKPEYAHLHIAGGMLFFDEPAIQHEATAQWDGTEHSLKHALKLDDPQGLSANEIEEKADYAAWWFLCIPTCCISLDNLPLPLFIKCDDIEYGLRNMKECTVINGIGVWHESFDKKFNTVLDYYSIRNELILNGIYKKNHTGQVLWLLLKPHLRAIAYGLITSVPYVKMAVDEYLQGVEFLRQTDGEEKNRQLRAMGPETYMFPKHSDLQRIWSVLRKISTLSFWKIWLQYFKVAGRYLLGRRRANKNWQDNWKSLTTEEFWRGQLELEE